MRRLLLALLGPTLLLAPLVARAHDPLDDVSGEEDLNNPGRDAEKPKSHKKERQEQELAKEVQEHEETEFHVSSEKEEFLRDRSETKEVRAGQVRRAQLSGGAARPHRQAAEPRAKESPSAGPAAPAEPASGAERGDVDPTESSPDSSMKTDATPTVEGTADAAAAPAPSRKKKKKR